MRYIIEPTVAIITPSIGSPKLEKCADSIIKQSYQGLKHIVVYDGMEKNKLSFNHTRLEKVYLPYNTGSAGFYGHRIYSAFSKLVNADLVFLLDEDNWYEPDHVKNLVDLFTSKPEIQFAHSLRKIHSEDGELLIYDNCESLGKYPIFLNDEAFLIDTSSYAFRGPFFRQVGHIWDFGWGADRRFYDAIKQTPHACTGKHTLCYRLDGNPNSVNVDFFKEGNQKMKERYGENLPWVIN